jgi:hypothetical protein
MLYSKRMTSANPGLMVFLIDCSSSMALPMLRSATDDNNSVSKFEAASMILNNFLYDCMIKCTSESTYKDYVDFVILGYGDHTFSPISKISPSEYPISVNKLEGAFASIEDFSENESDTINSPMTWINENSVGGNTAMLSAFTSAKRIILEWVEKHPDSHPPVLINISDGMANDLPRNEEEPELLDPSPLIQICNDIKKIQTNDGNVTIGNIHLSDGKIMTLMFPVSLDEALATEEETAPMLYEMASTVPAPWLEKALDFNFDIKQGSKFYIYNSDFDNFLQFFKFGTNPTNP